MKILKTEIRRVRPRVFWEFATLELEPEDTIHDAKTLRPKRPWRTEVKAKRRVYESGKALGPWLFLFLGRIYSIREEGGLVS